MDLDLCGDRIRPLCLRKVEIEAKEVIREFLAIFTAELDAKRTMSSAYCKICVSGWRRSPIFLKYMLKIGLRIEP